MNLKFLIFIISAILSTTLTRIRDFPVKNRDLSLNVTGFDPNMI